MSTPSQPDDDESATGRGRATTSDETAPAAANGAGGPSTDVETTSVAGTPAAGGSEPTSAGTGPGGPGGGTPPPWARRGATGPGAGGPQGSGPQGGGPQGGGPQSGGPQNAGHQNAGHQNAGHQNGGPHGGGPQHGGLSGGGPQNGGPRGGGPQGGTPTGGPGSSGPGAGGGSGTGPSGGSTPTGGSRPGRGSAGPSRSSSNTALIDAPTNQLSPEQLAGMRRGSGGVRTDAVAPDDDAAEAPAGRPSKNKTPRRASLQVKRLDPWSVLKLALVLGVALFFVWMFAVGVLYAVLDGMGVWAQLNGTYQDLTSDSGGGADLITAGGVFGVAAVVGVINTILFTALASVSAFIYNISADVAGGIEVTLSERD